MPASTALFKKYPNKWFVETGSYKGDGIQHAIDAGFQSIASVELSFNLHKMCVKRFTGLHIMGQLLLFCGESERLLKSMIPCFQAPITFWLDAHYSEGCTTKGDEMTPILKELAIIAEHPVKTHTILIDDVRQFGTKHFGFVRDNQIVEAIRLINPDYKFTYDTGDRKFPHDVLVARV